MLIRRLVLAVVLGLALAACGDSLDWREFDWPEGEFRVLLPARPDKQSGTVTIGAQSLQLTLFPVRAQGIAFAVGYADLPASIDAAARVQLLDDAANAFLKNLGADKPAVKALTVGEHPAREFRGTGTREGKARAIVGRVVATDKRFYQVVAIAPPERAEDADLQLFVDSLKVGAKK